MCGIAGVLNGEGSADALIDALAHRGPNGIRIEDGKGWSIGHARLSIIDLEGGWQPLHAAGSTVIGNGEIYNYLELAEEFGLKDRLATGSDFEPLLHLYAMEGEKAFDRLRGMYAFCLVGHDGRTWLVRDPFGIKPLYFRDGTSGRDEGAGVLFASEPRALADRPPLLNEHAAGQLLALNYSFSPSMLGHTLRLEPGAVAEVVGDFVEPRRIRPALPAPGVTQGDEAQLLKRLDSVLEDSVRVHQRSDVPYGLFLSGGVDSATIATLMARLNERPVIGFTCGFDAPGARDERAQAERVARALNLDWRETSFGEDDFWDIAPKAAWALDDPTADYAVLPTYKLAQAARDDLTVVLTGEGGDELFGGYGRYRRALRPGWLGGRPAEPRVPYPWIGDWRDAVAQRAVPGRTALQDIQAADVATWLPDDLLLKLDRCLMANGLEGRTPFLDPEVAKFAFNLPDRMKLRGRYGKWLLRKWLERHCPAAEPWARKQGFTVPVAAWIAPRAADLGPRIAAVEGVRAVQEPETIAAIFADAQQEARRWPLLFLALWCLIHLEGAEPAAALASLLGEA
ncbi:MAG TPA: asparagine synthase (glutamine-hydrolyzing) [Caulobacter sp.]|nr:asparagine synthase (glutamine-hydrolyzing) [Caulobacter sp.]